MAPLSLLLDGLLCALARLIQGVMDIAGHSPAAGGILAGGTGMAHQRPGAHREDEQC